MVVKYRITDLFGKDTAIQLADEDPEDAILDPNIKHWKL